MPNTMCPNCLCTGLTEDTDNLGQRYECFCVCAHGRMLAAREERKREQRRRRREAKGGA